MHESYTGIVLPSIRILSYGKLLEQYTNLSGDLRVGKLLDNLKLTPSRVPSHRPSVDFFGLLHQAWAMRMTNLDARYDLCFPLR